MNNNRENIKMCGIDAYFGTSELNLSALATCVAAVVLKRQTLLQIRNMNANKNTNQK